MKKTTKFFICAGILFWLTALLFATLYDLDITIAIASENSLYGRIFEVLGEIPAVLFTSFNFALMAVYFVKCTDFRGKNKILAVLTFIGCAGTAIFSTVKTAKYIFGSPLHLLFVIYAAAIGLAISFGFVLLSIFIGEDSLKKYFRTATSCAIAAILTFVIIWAFKLTWGRVRPRQLELGGGYFAYTPWYLPRGFTGHFSFPSGHTANATVIFSVVYYFRFLGGKVKKLIPLFYAVLAVWLALVAFSRVVVGAHFLSDVLFGCAITLAIVYFARPRKDI